MTRWRAARRATGSRPRCAVTRRPARRSRPAGATVLQRALPLLPAGVPIGALVLVRDVTEVRRRDRELITKDATIREIHHRVKNNLQTVAALLRLQARRVDTRDARAALEESVRRVASIAIVHETLSMSVDEAVEFDGVVDRVAAAAVEVAAPGDQGAPAPGQFVRGAAGRGRHAAGHGAQRAAAQRGRARLSRAGDARTARWSSRRTGSAASCT